MKTQIENQIKVMALSVVLLVTGLSGCSNEATRITPGKLEVSSHVEIHNAKIANIIQLSEKEAPDEKMLTGVLAGALIGAAITNDGSEDAREAGIALGSVIGGHLMMNKHGKTIYRLSLALDDGRYKEVFVRGGNYIIGQATKLTINKNSGEVTSFKLANS